MRPAAAYPRGWWEDRRFLVLLVFLTVVPLLWPSTPPLVDLYGHMGRYKVQLDLDTSPYLGAYYGFEWRLIGNLGVDLLVIPLAPVFGLELAVKLIVIGIVLLTSAGILWISHEVHGRISPAAIAALPFVYAHPFMFGFVNFALGMALALNAFALWLTLGHRGRYRLRAYLFVPIGLAVWVTHSFAWGVLGLLCFSGETVHWRHKGLGWVRAAFTAGIHCLSLSPPLALMFAWRSDAVEGKTGDWFNMGAKLLWFKMTLRDRWQAFDTFSLWTALGLLGALGVSRVFEFSRNLAASALVLAIAFVCLPRIILGSAYADMRLIPYVLMIALIALRPKPDANARTLGIVAAIALIFTTVRLAGNTVSLLLYDRLHQKTLEALNHIPEGARLLTFVGREARVKWYTNRQEHLPAMAIVRKQAFSNDQWDMAGAQLLRIRKTDAPSFVSDPSQLVSPTGGTRDLWLPIDESLRKFPRNAFDYLWLIDPPPFDPALLGDVQLIWKNDRDALYRIGHDNTARSDTPKGSGTRPTR